MLLVKAAGGVTITWRGKNYTWKADNSAVKVPYEMGLELLAIQDGGFSVAEEAPAPVTEPAPAAKAAVTEPAPKATAAISEARPAGK
jgi:hypothetical protein